MPKGDGRGSHFDQCKPRVDLVPTELILGAGRALGYGAKKYGPDNFRQGIETRRIAGSVFRHLLSWLDREDVDPESGLEHLDHAAASLSMLMWTVKHCIDLDDRWDSGLRSDEECNVGIR